MSSSDTGIIPLSDPSPDPVPDKKTKPRKIKAPPKPKIPQAPLWPAPEEAGGRSWLVIMIFLGLIGLYAWALTFYYAGAHGGVDQAGYLMTARLIAGDKNFFAPSSPAQAPPAATMPASAPAPSKLQAALAADDALHHPAPAPIQTNPFYDFLRNRLSFIPETPFQFASRMCIITEPYGPADPAKPAEYRVFAKYPPGFPFLAAIGRWIGGFDGMYYVNPICTVAACYFAYFLFRQAVSPFMSLLGVIWLACNPLVFNYANDANSHASTLFFVTIGFWGLLSWLRTQSNWRGWIGGFALGYACTIRYSEFLLVLPVACAALLHFRFTWRRALESASVLFAWSIPVAILAAICWVSFGEPWKTGYTYCRESTGFAWKYLTGDFGENVLRQGNWETFMTQLNHTGLFLLWPLAVAGLFAMVGSAWRLGSILALWIIPSSILYMLYYWAPTNENTVGYLRFFMSIVPGMIFTALWLLERAFSAIKGERRASLIAATVLGLFVLIAAAMYLDNTTVQGFPTIFAQIGIAVWHLASNTWLGLAGTVALLLIIAGMWAFDSEYAAARTGMALGAGVITALGCGINLFNIVPSVENAQTRWMGLRLTVDNIRHDLPRGSVLFGSTSFTDDQLLNQLDAVGNWKLINVSLFNNNAFSISRLRLDRLDKDNDGEQDPDPIQVERSRFYVELLGRISAMGTLFPKGNDELARYRNALIDKSLDDGLRVAFIVATRAHGENATAADIKELDKDHSYMPDRRGYTIKKISTWVIPTADPAPIANLGRFNRAAGNNMRANIPPGPPAEIYGLYEITRDPPSTVSLTKSKNKPLPTTKPTTIPQ